MCSANSTSVTSDPPPLTCPQPQGEGCHNYLLHAAQPKVQGQGRGGPLLLCGEGQGCRDPESLGVLASTLYCAVVACW